jgi:hypothetical protein
MTPCGEGLGAVLAWGGWPLTVGLLMLAGLTGFCIGSLLTRAVPFDDPPDWGR